MRLSNQPKASEIIANDTRKGNTPFASVDTPPDTYSAKANAQLLMAFLGLGREVKGFSN